jgi:hypothetical protein
MIVSMRKRTQKGGTVPAAIPGTAYRTKTAEISKPDVSATTDLSYCFIWIFVVCEAGTLALAFEMLGASNRAALSRLLRGYGDWGSSIACSG